MPIRDGDRSPCLVISHADEHKRPDHTYAHTPRTAFRIHKILSLFILNKNTGILQQNQRSQGWSGFGSMVSIVLESQRMVRTESGKQ